MTNNFLTGLTGTFSNPKFSQLAKAGITHACLFKFVPFVPFFSFRQAWKVK